MWPAFGLFFSPFGLFGLFGLDFRMDDKQYWRIQRIS
jgi:hypothetical protein